MSYVISDPENDPLIADIRLANSTAKDETKLYFYIYWPKLMAETDEAVVRPALLSEFRQSRYKIADTSINSEKMVTDRTYTRYVGFSLTATTTDLKTRIFSGWSKFRIKPSLFKLNLIHVKTGLLIGGEIRFFSRDVETEFEIHIAKLFKVGDLLNLLGGSG